MFKLKAERRGLVLPQFNVMGFADSPWKALPFGRSKSVMDLRGAEGEQEEG